MPQRGRNREEEQARICSGRGSSAQIMPLEHEAYSMNQGTWKGEKARGREREIYRRD